MAKGKFMGRTVLKLEGKRYFYDEYEYNNGDTIVVVRKGRKLPAHYINKFGVKTPQWVSPSSTVTKFVIEANGDVRAAKNSKEKRRKWDAKKVPYDQNFVDAYLGSFTPPPEPPKPKRVASLLEMI